jgi:hypothetical protein
MRNLLKLAAISLVFHPLTFTPAQTEPLDHLTSDEIAAAVAAKPDSGFAMIFDNAWGTADCTAQLPSESIYTPAGWLNAKSQDAKRAFHPFQPSPDDTLHVLRVFSRGCVAGSNAGPTCDSITRVALLSDRNGSTTAEALSQFSASLSWQNGYGATASCGTLVTEFSMRDVAKVRQKSGEFFIATFNGETLLKIYEVKEKYLKKLGI